MRPSSFWYVLLVALAGDLRSYAEGRGRALGETETNAVGRIADCTGTLVAPRLVLTARHCHVRAGDTFCGAKAGACIVALGSDAHEELDLALVTLEEDATLVLHAQPIAVLEALPRTGTRARWVGFGERSNGGRRRRALGSAEVVGAGGKYIFTERRGEVGACFGDSGAPLLITDDRGEVWLAGVLHGGDAACRGTDEYTRLDAAGPWLRRVRPQSLPAVPREHTQP
jgi:hypothetical protein